MSARPFPSSCPKARPAAPHLEVEVEVEVEEVEVGMAGRPRRSFSTLRRRRCAAPLSSSGEEQQQEQEGEQEGEQEEEQEGEEFGGIFAMEEVDPLVISTLLIGLIVVTIGYEQAVDLLQEHVFNSGIGKLLLGKMVRELTKPKEDP